MTSFGDLVGYAAIPRLTSLRLSPDGTWLAAAVQALSTDRKKYVSSIWRLDPSPDGAAPARLTRSAEGESGPAFLPDGSLLFVSARPDPAASPAPGGSALDSRDKASTDPASTEAEPADGSAASDDEHTAALWLLPARGGEAYRVFSAPGGVSEVVTARAASCAAVSASVLPGAADLRQDASRRAARKDAGVSAILHESGAVRYWDTDLGPDQLRLLGLEVSAAVEDGSLTPRDLTPAPGRALDQQEFGLAPDGSQAVTGWTIWDDRGDQAGEVHAIELATGKRRVLLAEPGQDFGSPVISPDGTLVAAIRQTHDSYDKPGDHTLVLVPLAGGSGPRDLLDEFDRRPSGPVWAPDSASIYFTADDLGRRRVFRADLASGSVTRVTGDDGAYDDLSVAPDGRYLYAIRAAVDEPPTPVRIDLAADGQADDGTGLERLACPGTPLAVPGRLTEIETTADDGAVVRSWLVLPEAAAAASPAPLLLWAHGGPLSSWNSWSWRWNPWLMAAQGYAVLLPDPALSTGYGRDFIARGHGQWGGNPYRDLMAITDAAQARPDIDESRTAMMGGSYGGYMANWMAGHTDRFRAIVTHASVWALDQMFGTTDLPPVWRRVFGDPATQPERFEADSPNRYLDQIRTPMLIIHGDKDYRVPIGEGLRLWWDLQARGSDVKFLYYPDENHWVLTPGNAVVWYQTVLAFLGQHVLGQPWQRPDLL